MKDEEKTKAQLIEELAALRQQFDGELAAIDERKRTEEVLQEAHDELERQVRERTAELTKANEILREKDRLLVAFQQITQETLSSLELDEVLDKLTKRIVEVGIFRSLMVALVDEPRRTVKPVRSFTCRRIAGRVIPGDVINRRDKVEGLHYHLDGDNITAVAARTGEMQIIEEWDERLDKRVDTPEERKGQVAYFIPVKKGGSVLAVLATASRLEEKQETLHRIEVMQPLVDQVAIALRHAQLYEEVQKEMAERKRTEDTLRKSEERLKILFEFAPDGYYLNDLKGNFVDGNRAAEEIVGYKKEELIGKNFLKLPLLPPQQIPKAAMLLGRSVLRHPTGPDEFTLNRKDGSQRVVEIRTYPVKIDGQMLVLGMARDITTRKQAEEALRKSEEKYRELVENINEVLYSIDRDGVMTYVSPASESFLGYSPSEVIGRPFSAFVCSEDLSRLKDRFQKILSGDLSSSEYRVLTKSGKIRWIQTSSRPVFMEDRVVGVQGVLIDITERKQAEEALRESEMRYRSFMQNFQGIVFQADLDFTLEFLHGAVEEITGYTEEEFIAGKPRWDQVIHPDDISEILESLEGMHSIPGYAMEWDYRIVRRDGQTRWVQEFAQNICDNSGEAIFVQGAIYDITERKQLEKQLRQSQKMQAIGQLTAGIAHNFNNMLLGIMGNIELALMKVPESQKHHLHGANSYVLKAAEMVKQLMAFSHREESIEFKPVEINNFIHDAVAICRKTFDRKIDIAVETPEPSLMILGDAVQLEQVLLNLCLNARDALVDVERRVPRIELKVDSVYYDSEEEIRHPEAHPGQYVRVRVADNGVGMDIETQNRVWEPFFTTKEADKGTGLGLSTAYAIVQQHQGWIEIESQPGVGTTLSVYLPATDRENGIEEAGTDATIRSGTEPTVEKFGNLTEDPPRTDWYLYIIRCGDGTLYTGITTDVKRRFGEHQTSGPKAAKYLKGRGPLRLMLDFHVGDQETASKLEYRIKRLSKREKEKLIKRPKAIKAIIARINSDC